MPKRRELTSLEIALDRAIRELGHYPIGSANYLETMEIVLKLHRMKEEEKSESVSKNTLLVVAGNLLGIVLIINHEYFHPVMSRAMGLLLKPKL
jgi:hypothetical protein